MRMLATLGLLLALPLLSVRAAPETTRAEGPHFRVILHFEADGLERAALDQVEALWDAAAAVYGLPKGPRAKKLEVNLYRDTAAYEIAEEKLTKGRFKRNLAFAHHDTLTAHVALQPFVSDEVLKRIGLPLLTRSLLLHEASHLVRYSSMPNFRSHPGWFEDGIAMWLKNEVLVAEKVSEGLEREPIISTSSARMKRLVEQGRLPSVASILADDIDGLGFTPRYSCRWLFFRFLMETYPNEMKAFVPRVKRLGGGKKLPRKMKELLAATLEKKPFMALDRDFGKFLRGLEPEWEEALRSLEGSKKRRVGIAFPSSNAVAYTTKPVGRKKYELAGSLEILPNSRHQMNVIVDRSEIGFICVALVADYGVTILEYTAKGDVWRRCAGAECGAVRTGKSFTVSVRVDGKKLTVSIGGEAVADYEFQYRSMTGAWGLGALSGSAGIWKDFGVK